MWNNTLHQRWIVGWLILMLGGMLMGAGPAHGQDQPVLYAALNKSKGYVVGAALSASGLYRHGSDSAWVHVGWSHPYIRGVSYDPTNPDIIFLAAGNGALRTMDGGTSWRITTGWEVTEAQDIAVDPNAPEHVYIATAYGVWRTTDQGATWTEANGGLPEKYTQAVVVDHTQAGHVFAGTWGGVYRSTDGAQSWSLAGPEDVAVLDIQQSPTDPDLWIAGTQEDGVLLSEDGGATWRFGEGNLAGEAIYATAIDPFDAQHMAAAGWDTGVYVSTNGGRTWERRGKELPIPHFYELIFDANEPGRLWAATIEEGVYYSEDMGRTWQPAGMDGTLVFDMIFIDQQPE